MVEITILLYLVEYMESIGSTYQCISFNVDEEFFRDINKLHKYKLRKIEIEKAIDKCLAHEWLEHKSLGGNRLHNLGITPKGIGVAISKRRSEELKKSRSPLKKISDYIEDHKGLFVFLSFIVALATFSLNIYWRK